MSPTETVPAAATAMFSAVSSSAAVATSTVPLGWHAGRSVLLLIDPQNDFCDLPAAASGSGAGTPALPVAGADADMQRCAEGVGKAAGVLRHQIANGVGVQGKPQALAQPGRVAHRAL